MGNVKNIARCKFVKMAVNSPREAANELRAIANGLEACKNTEDTIFALMSIYGVSERTINRDCHRDIE